MKVKLWTHQKNFSEDEVIINTKTFPDIKIGDVIEVRNSEVDYSPLLVQVKSLNQNLQQKDGVISISQAIATIFHLRMYNEVEVNVVNPKDVALDLVELSFREQYLSRADMWRMRKNLVNSCLYLNQKVAYVDMRTHVHELWSKGDKVTCGYVTDDTRITFRSLTAQVNIFIQMSSEMWEFDNYGDMYFEKAINGFLVELFNKWKETNCNHDVTITLFSRTFYDAKCIEAFPMHLRECVQQHSNGYFYEDYYHVVVQNEKYEDWTKTVVELRKLFNEYNTKVVQYHKSQGHHNIPSTWNSTAAEGNLLEVLNMGLNVFEKYYLDRCFDRTGKLSVVVTPGPGVFEVDRQLASITKHRTIDCGNSSDLVCMGEQPLHVVPLFKFHVKQSLFHKDTREDYNVPHWINHSFYTSKSQATRMSRGIFIPRIKMPQSKSVPEEECKGRTLKAVSESTMSNEVPFVDYDEYDAQVFKFSENKTNSSLNYLQSVQHMRVPRCQFSEAVIGLFSSDVPLQDIENSFIPHSFGGTAFAESVKIGQQILAGSFPGPSEYLRPSNETYNQRYRALFNPFTPSKLRFKVTSNRRRWAHAFPTDFHGASVQLHHKNEDKIFHSKSDSSLQNETKPKTRKSSDASEFGDHSQSRSGAIHVQAGSQSSSDSLPREAGGHDTGRDFKKGLVSGSLAESVSSGIISPSYERDGSLISGPRSSIPIHQGMFSRSSSLSREPSVPAVGNNEDGINWIWGLSGEQEWTPEITTGVDWKSMSIPASLPITTDYFPDKHSLENDYVFKNYTLLPDDINSESRSDKSSQLSTVQVYKEMVAQRIAQGFQLVIGTKTIASNNMVSLGSSPHQGTSSLLRRQKIEPTEETILSIGRIFHRLTLIGPKINVTTYWPRHPYHNLNRHYIYRFQVPDSDKYDVSWTDMQVSVLEHYNWNHVDSYLCTKGEDPYTAFIEPLKYWRAHFVLLPCHNPATKMIIEGAERCDIYEERSFADQEQLLNDFLRFVEMLNKLRRPTLPALSARKESTRRQSVTSSPAMSALTMDKDKSFDGTPTSRAKVIGKITDGMETPPAGSYSASVVSLDASLRKTPGNEGTMIPRGIPKPEPINTYSFSKASPLSDVSKAMLNPNGGLYFVKQQLQVKQQFGPSILPDYCFIADEAITWVKVNLEGVDTLKDAVAYLQRMLDEKLICHASENQKHRFIQGFYLYYFREDTKGDISSPWSGAVSNREFEMEWLEAVTHCPEESACSTKTQVFLEDTLPINSGYEVPVLYEDRYSRQRESAIYKSVNVVADPSNKSDREEWGSADYHSNYTPGAAFELVVKWFVATGCILGDLVLSWARRAGGYGFHFLPVPGDPFALPFTPGSDPFRGPIFIPLNIDCLKSKHLHLFEDFAPDTREQRLLLFQESILNRFGFISDRCPIRTSTKHGTPLIELQSKYVHCSGGMFAMIPDTKTTSPRNKDGTHCRFIAGSLNDYIALASGMSSLPKCECLEHHRSFYQVGFLWSWNFMLGKRWRSSNTGDEAYQDKMLADFRAFCSNSENRLCEYWNKCHEQHEAMKFAGRSDPDGQPADNEDALFDDTADGMHSIGTFDSNGDNIFN